MNPLDNAATHATPADVRRQIRESLGLPPVPEVKPTVPVEENPIKSCASSSMMIKFRLGLYFLLKVASQSSYSMAIPRYFPAARENPSEGWPS